MNCKFGNLRHINEKGVQNIIFMYSSLLSRGSAHDEVGKSSVEHGRRGRTRYSANVERRSGGRRVDPRHAGGLFAGEL